MNDWLEQARNYLEFQARLGPAEIIAPRRVPEHASGATPQGKDLEKIRVELGDCVRCPLHETRTKIVFGEGNPSADLIFIGEGPGADEDRQGRPFVGRAGQLLTKMINAMTLDRNDVYIANMVKCRPPRNRNPNGLEIETCFPFLEAQIESIGPRIIVSLGKVATGRLLETNDPISKLRGKLHDRNGIPVMPTYHPSFLLRNESDRRWKAETWSDLKQVMARLEIPIPEAGARR